MLVRHINENSEQADGQVHSGELRKECRLQVGIGRSSVDRWHLKPRLHEVCKGVSIERK